jgi:alginate O-acetyltransferase complex protein AlgI
LGLTSGLGRKRYKALAANPIYIAFSRCLTFSWFAFTLFWFWADWKQIDQVFVALSGAEWLAVWTAV